MLVIEHARVATMTGPQTGDADAPLAIIEDGAVACDGDRIAYLGRTSSAPPGGERIEAEGALLAPGLIDPHTHLIFAGDRAREHGQRLAGGQPGEQPQRAERQDPDQDDRQPQPVAVAIAFGLHVRSPSAPCIPSL